MYPAQQPSLWNPSLLGNNPGPKFLQSFDYSSNSTGNCLELSTIHTNRVATRFVINATRLTVLEAPICRTSCHLCRHPRLNLNPEGVKRNKTSVRASRKDAGEDAIALGWRMGA